MIEIHAIMKELAFNFALRYGFYILINKAMKSELSQSLKEKGQV